FIQHQYSRRVGIYIIQIDTLQLLQQKLLCYPLFICMHQNIIKFLLIKNFLHKPSTQQTIEKFNIFQTISYKHFIVSSRLNELLSFQADPSENITITKITRIK